MQANNIKWEPTPKQFEALQLLEDSETTELLYGGAAGGGKTYFGCAWIIISALRYPGTRYLVGRAVLKALKQSTLLTFFEICKEWGLKQNVHYKYNSIDNVIKFFNGSEVYLKDLAQYPSDPEYDSLGSTEYTYSFIDEASQVPLKAYMIVKSRQRYKLDEYGLLPRTLVATNPAKNFLYSEFYKPSIEKTLPKYRKFLPSLVTDNPFISKHYIENLKKLDKNSKERLLYGNWDYDDDPSKIFDFDALQNMFKKAEEPDDEYYLTVDLARMGGDRIVLVLWKGFYIKKIFSYVKQKIDVTEDKILEIKNKYNISNDNIIVDEDGMGGGTVDRLEIQGFVNNSRAIDNSFKHEDPQANYANLKAQCYFYLAKYVNEGKIGTYNMPSDFKETIIEELDRTRHHDHDKDGKLKVTPKQDIKELIGRSPDFADAIMFRMYFVLTEKKVVWDTLSFV